MRVLLYSRSNPVFVILVKQVIISKPDAKHNTILSFSRLGRLAGGRQHNDGFVLNR